MPFWTEELSSQPLAPDAHKAASGVLVALFVPWPGASVTSRTTRVLLSEATPSERMITTPLGTGAPEGAVQVMTVLPVPLDPPVPPVPLVLPGTGELSQTKLPMRQSAWS